MSKAGDTIAWRYKLVGLKALNIDERFQLRADGLDAARVKQYAFDMRRGDAFPPLTVASINGRLFLLDGFHRVAAASAAGITELNARIAKMAEAAAIQEAIRSNKVHGLNLKRKDKQNIFRVYLEREDHLRSDGSIKSLRQIARDLQYIVTHGTVRNWLLAAGLTPTEDPYDPEPLEKPDGRFISPGLDEFEEALGWMEELFHQLDEAEQTTAMYEVLGVADRLANGETRYAEAIARSNLPLDVARKLDI